MEPERRELIERARRFKRSWVEMAEALVEVRASRAYERWGYDDLYAYCSDELHIRKSTVDKLTGSYVALRRHAPEVLARDGVRQPIPAVDSVDYFAQALRATRDDADGSVASVHPPDVIEELRQAVFDDGENVVSLRRRFNPILHPKPPGASDLEALERTRAAARRLDQLLDACPGLAKKRATELRALLVRLDDDLGPLVERARARIQSVA
jgi:hypothetical protein